MVASVVLVLLLASALAGAAAGGDIVHQDDQAPKILGCSNDFVLVMRPQHGVEFSVKELNSISWNVGENPQKAHRLVMSLGSEALAGHEE
ncbi:hypothetical protein ZWY2020_050861 [Hordeum vulgare]|nr:hypothetical protein ZWY2020_050861 [Hordeum vulgare]